MKIAYAKTYDTTDVHQWAGIPALLSPNNVMVLFTKVDRAAPTQPQSAIWHFGWHVTDVRNSLAAYEQRSDVHLLPLYTTEEGGSAACSG